MVCDSSVRDDMHVVGWPESLVVVSPRQSSGLACDDEVVGGLEKVVECAPSVLLGEVDHWIRGGPSEGAVVCPWGVYMSPPACTKVVEVGVDSSIGCFKGRFKDFITKIMFKGSLVVSWSEESGFDKSRGLNDPRKKSAVRDHIKEEKKAADGRESNKEFKPQPQK
ncbi:hypothetical protein QJS10_CPB17g01712 [Acorus calamus]|uniref:Uncharacterized protein n=1 Tax=Acorus calamus TaxID=4465 RepID=A0AAV9CYT5_ACOCL|nr:hypothetical protein QJS10_CPB17g01712 [Acorus calamus]